MLTHALFAAEAARSVCRTVVVTGSSDAAVLAATWGAEVWHPDEMTPDPAAADLAHFLLQLTEARRPAAGAPPWETIIAIDCRRPLLTAADIDGLCDALVNEQADWAVAVTAPAGRVWRHGPDGTAVEDGARHSGYVEAGALYAARVAGRGQGRADGDVLPWLGKTALHVMPHQRAWSVAERSERPAIDAIMARRARASRLERLPLRPAALVMDFDGVFTDNRVLVDETGKEAVMCNRSDGLGLEQLRDLGLPMVVMSKERNPVVQARCRKLKLECLQGIDDKRPALDQWCADRRLRLADVVYIGNDTNDLPCFDAVGCAVAVADAHDDALRAARIILAREGGRGALRELTDMLAARLRAAPLPSDLGLIGA